MAKTASPRPHYQDKGQGHTGGVGEDGTSEREAKVSWEISHRETATSQPPEQGGHPSKAGRTEGEVGAPRSSCEPPQSKSGGEPRGGAWVNASQSGEGSGDGWSDEGKALFERIITPQKIQKLQRTLYRKAKAEPGYRFYSLYGELCRHDLMDCAMVMVARNGGAAGIDGQTCSVLVSDEHREAWKTALIEELRQRMYRASPVRRAYILKDDGKQRPLGIPTVKDRVVQAAVVLLLLPILEADSHPHSYAYRPRRGAHDAIEAIKGAVLTGRTEVIDADLSGYFDSIPHHRLLRIVSRRVSDGHILKLIKGWLKAPIVERDLKTGRSHTKDNDRGTPQGGVISPVLANAYLNRLDWEVNERCESKPVMVRYADDFVILARPGQTTLLQERLKRWLSHRGLTLNEKKTRLVDLHQEAIKFLGFELAVRHGSKSGRRYLHIEPHPKSLQKLRAKVREKLNRSTLCRAPEEVIADVNRQLKGWSHYFHIGNSTKAFSDVNRYMYGRLSRWVWRKHGRRTGLWQQFTDGSLWEEYGLFKLPTWARWKTVQA